MLIGWFIKEKTECPKSMRLEPGRKWVSILGVVLKQTYTRSLRETMVLLLKAEIRRNKQEHHTTEQA